MKGGFIMAKLETGTFEKGNLLPSKRATKFKNAILKGNERHYSQLRLKAKAANERMRQLEKAGINSPAYQAVQAKLEVLGKRTKGARGRRFSETGNAKYNEMEMINKILDEFLNAQTSKLTGAKQYERDVWETANKNGKLMQAGITRDEWLEFWQNMPDKKNRLYGSSQLVAIMRAYKMKEGQLEDKDKMTMQEIADEINASKNLKAAYDAIGITSDEVDNAEIDYTKLRRIK